MPKLPESDKAVERGLAFLARTQEKDGSFVSFSSASTRSFRRVRSWQTTFVPALMLASLADLESALPIRKRLAGFLLQQKDKQGAFNYWSRSAPEYKSMPYPADLDDTFCALAALYLHDPGLIDERVLAQTVQLLLAAETAVGGPYRSWLVSPESEPIWLDVDAAVNSNIAYFLSLVSNRLPALDKLMEQAIVRDSFESPYYPSVYAFMYYFSRAYDGPQKQRLLRKIRGLSPETDLDRALYLTARLRLGDRQDMSRHVRDLLAEQRRDGSWAAAMFYADPVKNGKLYYNGGAALSTAFVLEALQLFRRKQQPASHARSARPRTSVLPLAKTQCRTLPVDIRRTVMTSLTKIAESSNGPEITGLGAEFNASLLKPLTPAPKDFLTRLGLANLYGWLAYTIYDDFIDDEGKPGLLPAANVAMRGALQNFLDALPADHTFHDLVRATFDRIDGANAWELAHCRYRVQKNTLVIGSLPDYGDLSKLAERSLGHTLAPLAILHAAKQTGSALRHTQEALQAYLIARQLNDDLHDWQDDLANGHITYVAARLLSELRLKRGKHELPELLAQARPQFWHKTLPAVCREMLQHIERGHKALARADIFTENNIIERLLNKQAASIKETLAQQGQAENFLKHYQGKAVKL